MDLPRRQIIIKFASELPIHRSAYIIKVVTPGAIPLCDTCDTCGLNNGRATVTMENKFGQLCDSVVLCADCRQTLNHDLRMIAVDARAITLITRQAVLYTALDCKRVLAYRADGGSCCWCGITSEHLMSVGYQRQSLVFFRSCLNCCDKPADLFAEIKCTEKRKVYIAMWSLQQTDRLCADIVRYIAHLAWCTVDVGRIAADSPEISDVTTVVC